MDSRTITKPEQCTNLLYILCDFIHLLPHNGGSMNDPHSGTIAYIAGLLTLSNQIIPKRSTDKNCPSASYILSMSLCTNYSDFFPQLRMDVSILTNLCCRKDSE